MKNARQKIVLTGLLFLSLQSLTAQINIGVQAGPGFSHIPNSFSFLSGGADPSDQDLLSVLDTPPVAGLMVSIPVEFELGPIFSIQPELTYVQRGSQLNYEYGWDGYTYIFQSDIRVNYIGLPILFNIRKATGPVCFHAYVGPSFSYLLSGKSTYDIRDYVDDELNFQDKGSESVVVDNDYINRIEIAGIVGAGVDFRMGKGALTLDLRANFSFSNLLKDNSDFDDLLFRNYGAMIGYKMPLSK